jgi:hypothetical protein
LRPLPSCLGRLGCAATLALVLAAGCEKVSHDSIDTWMTTEQGPEKLKATLAGTDHDADLRAHAGQNLILMDRFVDAKDVIADLPERERTDLMAKLAERLWESARFKQGQDALAMPSPDQDMAKDALFDLREFAGAETRGKIDGWLVAWLADGYYEGRAKEGRIPGRQIIRAVGPSAAPRLLESARSLLARPANADGTRVKIGDELLHALALSGDPTATGFVLDLASGDFKDETLGSRATAALWESYVEAPSGQTPLDGRAGLLPQLAKLVAIVQDEGRPGEMINDASDLIAAVGPPECLAPFVAMIQLPHARENYRWMGSQKGLRCAGDAAIVPIVEAIPTDVAYDRARLEKYVWREILAINARTKVAAAARELLRSSSWVARLTGAEVLAGLGPSDESAADAKRIRALAGDRKRLTGWWGKGGDAAKKPDPTLGQVMVEAAGRLELAQRPETK